MSNPSEHGKQNSVSVKCGKLLEYPSDFSPPREGFCSKQMASFSSSLPNYFGIQNKDYIKFSKLKTTQPTTGLCY